MRICKFHGCLKQHRARGYCSNHYYLFMRYGEPYPKHGKKGAGHVRKSDGYKIFQVNGVRKMEHIMIAENILGRELPKGAVVHHVDGDPLNNTPANLVVCQSQAYHLLLHKRQNALESCGNPEWPVCRYCGAHDSPDNLRIHKNGKAQHLTCRNKYDRDRRKRLKESM